MCVCAQKKYTYIGKIFDKFVNNVGGNMKIKPFNDISYDNKKKLGCCFKIS